MNADVLYLLQLTLNGIVLGLIYALIASGLALIFGVLDIINFAHGEMLMVGAYVMVFALSLFGGHYVPAMLLTLAASAVLGFILHDGFLARLRAKDFDRSILITMGISLVLVYGFQYLFGATPKTATTELGLAGLSIGGIRITWTRIAAAGLALVAFAGLWLLLYRTDSGRAMRAVAINRDAAVMVGVRHRRVARLAVIVATMLCGLAGAALAPVYLVQPVMGQALIVKAFALIIIGGLGSIQGAALAAVSLGVLESWLGGFTDSIFQESAAFIVMIAVLLFRPHGLFGRRALRAG